MYQNFETDIRICILRRFYNETSAKLYQSRLRNAGVDSFISNSITSTLLPFSEGGFILHVMDKDLSRARKILKAIDADLGQISKGDFKDADMDDIQYEKSVWEYDQKLTNSSRQVALVILIFAFLIFALFTLKF